MRSHFFSKKVGKFPLNISSNISESFFMVTADSEARNSTYNSKQRTPFLSGKCLAKRVCQTEIKSEINKK